MPTNRSFSQRFSYLVVGGLLALPVMLAVGALRDSQLNAQELQFRPQAGLYLPTQISIQKGSLQVRQKVGLTLGARLILTFNNRFGVVTGVTYIPGYTTFRGSGKKIDVGASSHLLTATTGAQYWLLPPARRLSWQVQTGAGVGFGGQSAYADLFESSTLSGVLGTTVRYNIGRIVSLHLRVRDRLYRVRFGSRNYGKSSSPLQISFGLSLPFVESVP
jgi:hypothetical protein